MYVLTVFFSSRRRHTRLQGDWSSDVCSSDLSKIVRFQRRIKHVKSESSESDPTTVSHKPEPFPSCKRNVRAESGTGKARARPAQPLRRSKTGGVARRFSRVPGLAITSSKQRPRTGSVD